MTKSQHGGPRPGAGRPPKPDHLKMINCGHFRLPRWQLERLANMPRPTGHIVREALNAYLGWQEPEGESDD